MDIKELYQLYQEHSQICTDTRQIKPNSLFFALKGANFDANKFAREALQSGAAFAIIDDPLYATDERCIIVQDVLQTLQNLARYHREQLHIPVLAITGTNGKTTTKELINAVLSKRYNTLSTAGNLNNHIGVPLTILRINNDVEFAVIEMGANHPGEIDFLCQIAQPTAGLITNVGKAHLEGFGSFEGVIKTKGELYDYLKLNNGQIFVNTNSRYLCDMISERKIEDKVTFGTTGTNDIIGQIHAANPLLSIFWQGENIDKQFIQTQLTGTYNLDNILASIALGTSYSVSVSDINSAIEQYFPQNNRSQVTKTQHNVVIEDYYNANASSMQAALDNMKLIPAEHKTLILGDMFELGEFSNEEHTQVIDSACAVGAERIIFVGSEFFDLKDDRAEYYLTTEDAKNHLSKNPVLNSTVLLKASRGMSFEKLMDIL